MDIPVWKYIKIFCIANNATSCGGKKNQKGQLFSFDNAFSGAIFPHPEILQKGILS